MIGVVLIVYLDCGTYLGTLHVCICEQRIEIIGVAVGVVVTGNEYGAVRWQSVGS